MINLSERGLFKLEVPASAALLFSLVGCLSALLPACQPVCSSVMSDSLQKWLNWLILSDMPTGGKVFYFEIVLNSPKDPVN